MDKKWNLPTSIFMMLTGTIILLWLLIRFFNQGYFFGEPRILYNFPFEMKDWFGTIIYSFLFALSGYFLLKKESNTLIICQFVGIGIIVDRIWYILERISNVDVLFSLLPMILVLLVMFYLILNRNNFFDFLKKVGSFILLNIVLISIGKFILPNM